MNVMGCLSCIRTAPTPIMDASVSTINGLLKSGSARTRALVITLFNILYAVVASSLHELMAYLCCRSP
jgi:hypothetical protein